MTRNPHRRGPASRFTRILNHRAPSLAVADATEDQHLALEEKAKATPRPQRIIVEDY